jgi:hypothetical protein
VRVAYIAHPVGGDVRNNINKILNIVRQINLTEPDVVPFVPYMADLYALDDAVPEERARGIKNDMHLLRPEVVDEVRLYGNRISAGMASETRLAQALGIPIQPMTGATMFAFTNGNY